MSTAPGNNITSALPPLTRIHQTFPRPKITDVRAELQQQLTVSGVTIPSGARIAIAIGSRGIANLAEMTRELVGWVKAQGGEPFLVPAMGSHGGATAEGQANVLAGFGITESAMGAPVCSSLDVIELPGDDAGIPVYFDKYAHAADGAIMLNRIKPHTSFHAQYESGLMKMLAIGLGKHKQALAIHQYGVAGLCELMPKVARAILRHANVLLGIAVVENAYDETMLLRALPAGDIAATEPSLLDIARANMPRLPAEDIDILIVDEIGKDISGLGMDPNIIGRLKIAGQPEPAFPRIKVIIVRDLTSATHGNAAGMGLADILLCQAADKIDYPATYANVATTGFLERAKLPLVAENDEEAFRIARQAVGPIPTEQLRVVWIKNTLHLEEVRVSPAILSKIE